MTPCLATVHDAEAVNIRQITDAPFRQGAYHERMWDSESRRGLLTVVFIDVEGSTSLLERLGDEAGSMTVQSVIEVARGLLDAHSGREVKALGDGLMIAFESPRQAVAYGLAVQRALERSTIRVRVGINTGDVESPHGDPLGGAVNAAARIAGKAGGGEVWVSDVVRQLIGSHPAIRFVDRGRVRLKGFSDRWRLWCAESGAPRRALPTTVGRGSELAISDQLIRGIASGVGGVVLFEGEAGIGKSHLRHDTTRRALDAGLHVIEHVFDEALRRPGGLGHTLLAAEEGRGESLALAELLHTPAAHGDDLRFALVEAGVDLVEALAADQPVLLAIDDLQWADDLSLLLLASLVHRVATSRWSVVGAMRPTPRPVLLDRCIERVLTSGGRHVRVDPLGVFDVAALATMIAGAPPGPLLRARLDAAAGNPLYVTELVRAMEDEDILHLVDGVADVSADATPTDLHQTLLRRLSWLPSETVEMLRLASVLGGAFTLRELGFLSGRPVVEVGSVLRDASAAGLIAGDGDRLTFRHDLIREAVYFSLLPAERREFHRVAGEALVSAGAPSPVIARQMSLGADPGDLVAVEWLERAAVESAAIAPAEAVAWLEQGIALAPPSWPGRCALEARMIEPLVWSGRIADAEQMAAEVLQTTIDDSVRFAALRGLSSVYGNRGDIVKAIETIRQATEVAGAPADEVIRLRCVAAQMAMLSSSVDVDDVVRLGERTLADATAVDDATTRCVGHQLLGMAAAVNGYDGTAMEHMGAAMTLLDSGRVTANSYIIADAVAAVCLVGLDRIDDGLEVSHRARRRAERRGAMALLPLSYMATCGAYYYAGRFDETLTEAEAARSVMEDIGSNTFVLFVDSIEARIALHRGDTELAARLLADGVQQLTTGGSMFGVDWLFHAQAQLLEASGDLAGALTLS